MFALIRSNQFFLSLFICRFCFRVSLAFFCFSLLSLSLFPDSLMSVSPSFLPASNVDRMSGAGNNPHCKHPSLFRLACVAFTRRRRVRFDPGVEPGRSGAQGKHPEKEQHNSDYLGNNPQQRSAVFRERNQTRHD